MHKPNQFDLLRERRFAPFFWTQFLGAGNDNVYKNALVIFVAFEAAQHDDARRRTRSSTSRAPCSSRRSCCSRPPPGQLADKFEKSRLIRWIKLFEIAIMVDRRSSGFWRRDLALLFTALALLGVHSTLFGPVKYAILPQHLKPEELIGGNGLVEMGTFVAILLGHDRRRPRRRDRAGDGPVLAGAAAIGDRGRRLAREPRDPAHAGGRARISRSTGTRSPRPGATSASRRRTASSGCRCSASRGSGSTARSFSRSSPASRATSWAATSTS